MKKITTFLLILTIVFSACEKKEKLNPDPVNPKNCAVPIYSESKAVLGFQLSLRSGHSGAGCSGCTIQNGKPVHVDCQGAGSFCQQSATIYLYPDDGEIDIYYAINTDKWGLTSGDFFLMPDRSLYIVGSNGEFINIPEQTLYRDEETGYFIIYDIFFSDAQMFENK
jgi:hypothetical protein